MAVDDVFPPRNLPDGAVEWGRTVEGEVKATQRDLKALAQFTSGQNRSTAASLEDIARQLTTIADQQADLLGRLSYSVLGPQTQTWNNETSLSNYAFGPTLSFTLTESRVVSISARVSGYVVTESQNGAASVGVLRNGILLDSSLLGPTVCVEGRMRGGIQSNGSYNRNEVSADLTARALVTLAAGSHTVQVSLTDVYASVTALIGATGAVALTAQSPALFVDVLQPA